MLTLVGAQADRAALLAHPAERRESAAIASSPKVGRLSIPIVNVARPCRSTSCAALTACARSPALELANNSNSVP